MMFGKRMGGLAAVAAVLASGPALAADSESVAITVYNQNFALVKDVRALDLVQGTQEVRIDDVAAAIDPTSVHFAALDRPGSVAVLEQNYQYDLADADRLLARYLNREIDVVLEDGSNRSGNLLSFSGTGIVLAQRDGATVVNRDQVRDVSLGEVPGGLVVKPTLVWMLSSAREATERAEISYLTDNIDWHAEYVAVVNRDDTGLDMNGWVSLDNRSGATYENAKLKLVAGDVHRAEEDIVPLKRMAAMPMEAMTPPQFEERGFFEYHIYTLERPTTVADRETKQLSLFPTATAAARKLLTYDGQRDATKVAVRMEFENSEANDLGMALPAGKVRVYKEDADGALEFVGEDRIDHTPRDEKLRLYLGNAFDVVGERKRTDFRKISARVQEETVEIEIRNHKDETVEVTVVEHLAGDWRILEQSQDFRKEDANTIEFPVSVEANGSVTVTYRVRTTW